MALLISRSGRQPVGLRPLTLVALAASLLTIGDAAAETGTAELDLYDQPVTCDPLSGRCTLPDGQLAAPVDVRTSAYLSLQASSYGPAVLNLYLELPLPDGSMAVLEADLDTFGSGVISYREVRDGAQLFFSSWGDGQVELPESDDCSCLDVRLELLFSTPGPDGLPDTADDEVRRISRGRISPSSPCLHRTVLAIPAALQIKTHCQQPAVTPAPAPAPLPPFPYPEEDTGCGYDDGSGESYEDTGCGYDDGSGYYEEDTGCEGDDWDSGSSSGCEGGDDWDSGGDWDSSGCEGDSSGSASACEGDALAAAPRARRGHRSRALGMLLPFVLLGLFNAALRRRRSRRSPRQTGPGRSSPAERGASS